jgi:hypothetical protein
MFNGLENVRGERVMNICAGTRGGEVFYWKNINIGELKLDAANYLPVIKPELAAITGNRLGRINSFSTDTCATMRAVHRASKADPDLSHAFTVLCDL